MPTTPSNQAAAKLRQVKIVVGLQWPEVKPTAEARDKRFALGEPWPTIQELIQSGAAGAKQEPAPRVALLRAASAGTIGDGIERSIQSADIAVFDVTPKRGRINENVLIEIGMAKGRGIPVILIAKSTNAHKALPADLQGMQVRAYAVGDEGGRRSIRAIVQSAVKRAKKELTGKEPA